MFYNAKPGRDFVAQGKTREEIKREFAKRLQAGMSDAKLSQSDLSRRIWGSYPDGAARGRDNISGYIRGVSLPKPAVLHQICKILGIDQDNLLPGGVQSVDRAKTAPYSITAMGDGTAWLNVDHRVPMEIATEILTMLAKADRES